MCGYQEDEISSFLTVSERNVFLLYTKTSSFQNCLRFFQKVYFSKKMIYQTRFWSRKKTNSTLKLSKMKRSRAVEFHRHQVYQNPPIGHEVIGCWSLREIPRKHRRQRVKTRAQEKIWIDLKLPSRSTITKRMETLGYGRNPLCNLPLFCKGNSTHNPTFPYVLW